MAKLKATEPKTVLDPTEAAARLIPPNTVVDARLAAVDEHSFDNQGEMIHKFRWNFVVSLQNSDWDGKEIRGETSTNFTNHPNCKAMNWAMALTGREFENGEELDTDEMIGLPCKVLIKHKPDREGRPWMRVDSVFSAGADATATPPESVF